MRRRCSSHSCRFPPFLPARPPSLLSLPSGRSCFHCVFRFPTLSRRPPIFTPGSSRRHGVSAVPELKSEQRRDDTADRAMEMGSYEFVLTYILYALSACYFTSHVYFPAYSAGCACIATAIFPCESVLSRCSSLRLRPDRLIEALKRCPLYSYDFL